VHPTFVRPLVATEAARPPRGPGWLFEPKFDGYRFQVVKDGRRVRLFSKSGAEYTDRLPGMVDAFVEVRARSLVVDGELCSISANGQATFERLHREMRTRWPDEEELVLIMFDLLHADGADLKQLPLIERRRELVKLFRKSPLPRMRLIQTFTDGDALFEHCARFGFEGIVAKKVDRPYVSGRSKCWVKVKCPEWKRGNQERFKLFEGHAR